VRRVPEQTDIPVQIALDREHVRSRTRASTIGPYVLVLDTVIPEKGIELHSTYTGHEGASTLASHLLLARGLQQTIAVEHEHDSIPVTHARRRCLYDHLQHLQDLIEQTGAEATIPIDEQAIAAIER
jgi:hypothetical protein